MGYVEEKTRELLEYRPALTREEDFDAFWEATIRKAKAVPLCPAATPIDYPIAGVRVYDIAYNGWDETRIRGWYLVPSLRMSERIPCLIHFHGFGGDRGRPADYMHWVLMGFAVLAVDCRDMGGLTGNRASYSRGHAGNAACKGIHDKNEYYFRAAYMDGLKAIDFACGREEVDDSRIVVEGGSLGGGIGMAVAALDDRPAAALVDVPSNSNLTARVEGAHGAFAAVAEYLKRQPSLTDAALRTLSYFDTMNMADRIECKVFASAALKDEVCPPAMYFATYNRIPAEKEVVVYPFNGHEGGGSIQTEAKLAYLRKHFAEVIG